MIQVASLFAQILSLIPRREFHKAVRQRQAEKAAIRPPLSKVWEPSDEQATKLVGRSADPSGPGLSRTARAVLEEAKNLFARHRQPVRLSVITERLGLTSRRKIRQILTELARASVARFERLEERGRPLAVVPMEDGQARRNRAQTRTETRAKGKRP